MAVVHFQRKEDAMKARTMYNHKVIDGSEQNDLIRYTHD